MCEAGVDECHVVEDESQGVRRRAHDVIRQLVQHKQQLQQTQNNTITNNTLKHSNSYF